LIAVVFWFHRTLIFLLKLRSFRFLMYLWIFSRLSSPLMRALLKLGSSTLDVSVVAGSRPGLMLALIWNAPPNNTGHAACPVHVRFVPLRVPTMHELYLHFAGVAAERHRSGDGLRVGVVRSDTQRPRAGAFHHPLVLAGLVHPHHGHHHAGAEEATLRRLVSEETPPLHRCLGSEQRRAGRRLAHEGLVQAHVPSDSAHRRREAIVAVPRRGELHQLGRRAAHLGLQRRVLCRERRHHLVKLHLLLCLWVHADRRRRVLELDREDEIAFVGRWLVLLEERREGGVEGRHRGEGRGRRVVAVAAGPGRRRGGRRRGVLGGRRQHVRGGVHRREEVAAAAIVAEVQELRCYGARDVILEKENSEG
jgi:hypothetical protein